ncbi:MAG: hypothetical protein AVDCRST_MAG31-2085 [uncultured Sphingomonas sp.]|uniref:Glycosyltransferase 2-like domain-containing protein n=1 Tax=uncultured Sphingomonas sp. TaxID=158754 RepID=A0A6J4TMF1_9SPHN|nr:glycosyltransferase [uncultured Sphingomonas sp.]CAA9527707.1 MAG: hypothetical protein AVDCRST_MAG31-2085 [uncultured Sphingomonas sp.]
MPQQIASPDLSVVICTYNGAQRLPAVLDALVGQRASEDFSWEVVVVDNGSTDGTRLIVEAFAASDLLPSLRYVPEPEPGLTAARLGGVRRTAAPWIAFVDDDNLLEPDWIAAVARAIGSHPDAGGIGGEIRLEWEAPPPAYLRPFGFCFAEQQVGPAERRADSLAGAGMVLNREALVASGWVDGPLLSDRTGKSLVSGGDVEIAQRVRHAGYQLWLTPAAVLRHRIPRERTTRRYLFEINVQLGISSAVMGVLTWPGDWRSWRQMAAGERARWLRTVRRGLFWSALRRRELTAAVAWACFARGYARGVRRCLALGPTERERLLGAGAARDG